MRFKSKPSSVSSKPSIMGKPVPYRVPVKRSEVAGDEFPTSRMKPSPGVPKGRRGMGVVRTEADLRRDDDATPDRPNTTSKLDHQIGREIMGSGFPEYEPPRPKKRSK